MAEFVLHPEKRDFPSASALERALEIRGWRVSPSVKGSGRAWEAVRFHTPGPPEIEVFLLHDPERGTLHVSVPEGAPARATWLQADLAHLLLGELGGEVEESPGGPRLGVEAFYRRVVRPTGFRRHLAERNLIDWFWPCFSWTFAVLGILLAVGGGERVQLPAVILSFLALGSAFYLTWDFFQPKH